MMNIRDRNKRQILIKGILARHRVSSQNELLSLLSKEGVNVTQATLSRDLREMMVTKRHSEDGYHYILPDKFEDGSAKDGIVSVQFSGQLAVIKTIPAYASLAAAMIDSQQIDGVMGTIAGDDTALVVFKTGINRKSALQSLSEAIPGLTYKLL